MNYENMVKVMVNNFQNINKTNNHLSPSLTKHEKTRHMALKMKVLTCGMHKTVNYYIASHHTSSTYGLTH
jgi:hypothetical protein